MLKTRIKMPQSLTKLYVHIVFSTKERLPLLADVNKSELHNFISKIFIEHDSQVIKINNMSDHIHILINQSKKHDISTLIKHVKQSSSKWLKTKTNSRFSWQRGYSAFSISQSNLDVVTQYIENQEEHHRNFSYQDELRKLLKAYDIEHNEEYLWD